MESHNDPRADYDPRDALADVAASRNSVADRLATPWWYHPALGGILAAIVLVSAFDLNNIVRLVVSLACAGGIGVLVAAYQRTTGLWVDIRNLGPVSRRWWFVYLVLVITAVAIAMTPSFSSITLPTWVAIVLTAATFIGTIVLGRRIDESMRVEIRSGTATAPRARR